MADRDENYDYCYTRTGLGNGYAADRRMMAMPYLGKFVGYCDNCKSAIHDNQRHFWVRYQWDAYLFCQLCVHMVEGVNDADVGKGGER